MTSTLLEKALDASLEMDSSTTTQDTRLQKKVDESRISRTRAKHEQNVSLGKPRLTREALNAFQSNQLPTPQNGDPNYKYVWLSTDPSARPLYHEACERLGYIPCKVADYPEMSNYVYRNKVETSVNNDVIMYKEMVLCKLHVDDWTLMMEEFHHNRPAQAAHDIFKSHKEKLRSYGGRVSDIDDRNFPDMDRDDDRTTGMYIDPKGQRVAVRSPKFNL